MNRINNALKFLEKLLHERHTVPGDISTKSPLPEIPDAVVCATSTNGPKPQKRKIEGNDHSSGEEEDIDEVRQKRMKRTKTILKKKLRRYPK